MENETKQHRATGLDDLALIGNCSISALVDGRGDVAWMCVPRFDSPALFNALLHHPRGDGRNGLFAIRLEDFHRAEQFYQGHSAILITRLWDAAGNGVEVTDFMPRFRQYGRVFSPTTLVRELRPLRGVPRIRVVLRPARDWTREPLDITRGTNHLRYVLDGTVMRLTSDLSINALLGERAIALDRPHALILGPDETVREAPLMSARHMREETEAYWGNWVRNLSIPFEWQEAVIRAAITLKLSAYDDTGAIIAATTTSIPEAPDTPRNWDYRFCWLRDAYFVINALNRLGKTATMERYLGYLINVIANAGTDDLQPVYSLDGESHLVEDEVADLDGYRGMKPVRIGNKAYEQCQNDVYGSVVLAAAHAFFDQRLPHLADGDTARFRLLERMGEKAFAAHDQPDAGPWELRGAEHIHTYSSLMCWAACDRLARIARHLGEADRAEAWQQRADTIHEAICTHAWNERLNSFVDSFGGEHLDASLLLLNELGFLSADDPRFAGTVEAIETHLKRGRFIFRYAKEDDFGAPETAFLVCTFWYINALAALGRRQEARSLFDELLRCRNRHGLLSEDIAVDGSELWGNFPQTYSMVGLINAAVRLSQRWEDAL